MTLASTTSKLLYNGDGSTTVFSVSFVFWQNSDIKVVLRDAGGAETAWAEGTHYTLTGGAGSTGSLTVKTTPTDHTPAASEKLLIKSALTETQDAALPLGGAFPSTTVEQMIDIVTRLVQQHSEEIARSFIAAETDDDPGVLPSSGDRANKFLAFDASGNAIAAAGSVDTLSVSTYGATLIDDAAASDARTTLGLGTAAVVNTGAAAGEVPTNDQAFANVASATTTDIGAASSHNVRITGTTTITGLGTVASGIRRKVRFAAALTLTHNGTSLILPGSASITTAANDTAEFHSLGSGNWLCHSYKKADGTAVSGGTPISVLDNDPTELEVVNTTTETSLYSFSIPADTLGTDKTIRLSLAGDVLANAASGTIRLRVKFGATTLYDDVSTAFGVNANRRAWEMNIKLSNVDSNAIQIMNGNIVATTAGAATTGIGQLAGAFGGTITGPFQGGATEDSTGALTFDVTIEWGAADANVSFRRKQAVLELLP